MLIQQVLKESPFSLRELAADTGLSYDTLRAWAAGRRIPRDENLRQIADVLESRAGRMRELAKQLRRDTD